MIVMLLALYTVLILYFLFIGFNRTFSFQDSNMRYNLIPSGIPLHLPIRIFELGNFVAFIPFGMFIPLLFRSNFIRFITLFILSITIVEILQMLSRLGSFDINDIIINTLGAAVGFGAQRLVRRDRDKIKGIFRILLIAIVISIGTVFVVGGINNYLDEGGGEVVTLNELTLTDEFKYNLNGKYIRMVGIAAVLDDEINSASNERSDIIFFVDGAEIYSLGLSAKSEETFQFPLNGANELTIKLNNDDPDLTKKAVMLDMTLTEVNIGQKLINGDKEKIRSLVGMN